MKPGVAQGRGCSIQWSGRRDLELELRLMEASEPAGRNFERSRRTCLSMVGAEGFEPPTLCSQNRSDRLLKPVEIE